MVQTSFFQSLGTFGCEANARGEQVGVKTQPMRFGHQQLQVVTHQRLATRKAALHTASGTCIAQHLEPFFGAEFSAALRVIHRVVAKHAMQRAAVGDFSQQPQGRAHRGWGRHGLQASVEDGFAHAFTQPCWPAISKKAKTSACKPVVPKSVSKSEITV